MSMPDVDRLKKQGMKKEETISERGGANTSSKQGSFAKSRKPKYRFGYRVAEKEPKGKEQVNETHTTHNNRCRAYSVMPECYKEATRLIVLH